MDVTELVTPITSTDGHKTKLGINKGTLDSNLDFLGDLDSKTDVASHITDSNNSLEAGSLTGSGLLLNGDDLHDIVLELVVGLLDESVDNLGFLDGDGVGVDFLEGSDFASVDQSSELGLGEPFILGGTITATWSITTATAAAASAESSSATTFTVTATAFCTRCFCHSVCF